MDASARHDVFVSYSSSDKAWADAVVEALERGGVRCWIAPRDILGGKNWPGAIVEAIHGCRVMVLVFSHQSNASEQVTRELVQAADRKVHVLPLRVDDVEPSSDKAYYLSGAHWLSVSGGPTDENLARLDGDVRRLLQLPVAPTPSRARKPRVARWAIAAASVVVIASSFAAWKLSTRAAPSITPEPVPKPLPEPVPVPTPEPLPGPGPAPHPEPNPAPIDAPDPDPEPPKPVVDSRWSKAPASLRDGFELEGTDWLATGGRELPARIRHRATGVSFVLVRADKFELGANAREADAEEDERPPRTVRMNAFYIARFETTRAQFEGRADANGVPIANVTWQQADDWCRRHGLTLPSEAQWEFAASGPANRRFPWGDAWDGKLCNSKDDADGVDDAARVGSFAGGASWCGADDMAGNLAEWCRGFYTTSYAELSGDQDPESPQRGNFRVARGGSWSDGQAQLRTSDRRRYNLEKRGDGMIGFRAAFEP